MTGFVVGSEFVALAVIDLVIACQQSTTVVYSAQKKFADDGPVRRSTYRGNHNTPRPVHLDGNIGGCFVSIHCCLLRMTHQASFLLEELPQVRQYQLLVSIPDGHVCVEPVVEAKKHDLSVTLRLKCLATDEERVETCAVHLDRWIDFRNVAVTQNFGDHICITAKFGDTSSALPSLSDGMLYGPAAAVNTLYCRFCSNALTTGPFFKTLALPSRHWQEMADLWTCEVETFKQFPRGEIRGMRGKCLVGNTYLLLNILDVQRDTVVEEAQSITEGDKVVPCAQRRVTYLGMGGDKLCEMPWSCGVCGGSWRTRYATGGRMSAYWNGRL